MDITDTTDREDCEEMARLAAGDETALDRLMERHASRLGRYLLRLVADAAEAEDLAQDAFVRVFRHAGRFDPKRSFVTWLFTIATNLARDRARRLKHRASVSFETPVNPQGATLREVLPARELSPSDQVLQHERAEAVRRAVARLPEDLRTPLVLAEYELLSHAEIAAITGGTSKAVEMRLYRARGLLRESLATWLSGG